MNKDIIELSNQAYKLLGYDVNIIPRKMKHYGRSWYEYVSEYNDIDLSISDGYTYDTSPIYPHIMNINPIILSNLYSFRDRHKSVFNINISECNLVVYSRVCNGSQNYKYLKIINYGNPSLTNPTANPTRSVIMSIVSTEKVINEFITNNLGVSLQPSVYYMFTNS